MSFYVNPEICIGCGLCTTIAEGVYEMTDAGVAAVVKQPDAGEEMAAQEALESCPVSAIFRE